MREPIMWNLVALDGCFEGSQPWDLGFKYRTEHLL
jgi:hypothetical protein